jgi:hypothetical protein
MNVEDRFHRPSSAWTSALPDFDLRRTYCAARMTPLSALSVTSRRLTRVVAAGFLVTGLPLFLVPGRASEEFAWKVTDFQAMTMGGWCLGNAFMAWLAARDWRWGSVMSLLIYLWAFSLFEFAVLVRFGDLIRFEGIWAWPYLVTLGVAVVAALSGLVELVRLRPAAEGEHEAPSPLGLRALGVVFVALVGYLGIGGVVDPEWGKNLNLFPEVLSSFTAKAFAVFYGAIAVGAVPLLFARTLAPTLAYTRGGMGLILPITVAALVYFERFDFSEHGSQVIYIGAYVGVFIAAIGLLAWARRRPTEA